jgi:hypothetical protein
VLSNPRWQKAALLLNLSGTIVLFYSFQATSSDFRLVTAPRQKGPQPRAAVVAGRGGTPSETQYALCVNNYTLLSSDASSGVRFAYPGCPSWENARPAAVVSIEHPKFEGQAFCYLLLGSHSSIFQFQNRLQSPTCEPNSRKRNSKRSSKRNKEKTSVCCVV